MPLAITAIMVSHLNEEMHITHEELYSMGVERFSSSVKLMPIYSISPNISSISKFFLITDLLIIIFPSCELDITIQPNESNFNLISEYAHLQAQQAAQGAPVPHYVLEITGLKLYCKKLNLMDGLALQLARKLELNPARYAVRKSMMKSVFISPG